MPPFVLRSFPRVSLYFALAVNVKEEALLFGCLFAAPLCESKPTSNQKCVFCLFFAFLSVCKSAGLRLPRFESLSHHQQKIPKKYPFPLVFSAFFRFCLRLSVSVCFSPFSSAQAIKKQSPPTIDCGHIIIPGLFPQVSEGRLARVNRSCAARIETNAIQAAFGRSCYSLRLPPVL